MLPGQLLHPLKHALQLLHPLKHALQIFTDTSKEGWCAHLKNALQGEPGPFQKASYTHKPPGTKCGLFGPKTVPRPLFEQHSSGSLRQHYSWWAGYWPHIAKA